jgi:predicted NAD/FAD-dependent oxidoreductase
MDSRASGIIEASDAGVTADDITKQSGNSVAVMKRGYQRGGKFASQRSNEKRRGFRKQNSEKSAANGEN